MKYILLIDTDGSPLNFLRIALEREGMAAEYDTIRIEPNVAVGAEDMLKRATVEISRVLEQHNIVLALVDIVVGENAIDTYGFKLAAIIRTYSPELPVYLMTNKQLIEGADDVLSEATFEDVDGVLIKNYVTHGMSLPRLNKLLRRPRRTFPTVIGAIVDDATRTAINEAKRRFGVSAHDRGMRVAADQFEADRFWGLISRCDVLRDAVGVIEPMTPGRSGAAVFKLRVRRENRQTGLISSEIHWLLKVSTDAATMARECEKYHEVGLVGVSGGNTPRLVTSSPFEFQGLTGLLLELMTDARVLRDFLADDVTSVASTAVARNLSLRLAQLYGSGQPKVTAVWREHYALAERDAVNILAALSECRLSDLTAAQRDAVDAAILFAETSGQSLAALWELTESVDYRNAHNDLNARNLMVTAANDVILIDLASVAPGPIVSDFAKLERDVVLRTASHGTTGYFDWSQLDGWTKYLTVVSRLPMPYEAVSSAPVSIRRHLTFIRALRANMMELSPLTSARVYAAALIHYFLKGIALPDISMQKRLIAVLVVSELAQVFTDAHPERRASRSRAKV